MGNKKIVHHFIKFKAKLDIPNYNGDTALHKAAYHFHKSVVELLVTAGAPLDVTNKVYYVLTIII